MNKRYQSILISACVVALLLGAGILPNIEIQTKPALAQSGNSENINIDFNFGSISITEETLLNDTFSTISTDYNGKNLLTRTLTRTYKPEILYRSVTILLPPGGSISDIVVSANPQEYQLNHKIIPVGPPTLVGANISYEDIFNEAQLDEAIYSSSDPYPGQLYEIGKIKDLHGFSIVDLKVFPIQYYPFLDKIDYYSNVDITIESQSGMILRSFKGLSGDFDIIEKIVENPSMTSLYNQYTLSQGQDEYEYVIITKDNYTWSPTLGVTNNERLTDEFQRLVDWKSNFTSATIVSIENITQNATNISHTLDRGAFWVDGQWGDNCGNSDPNIFWDSSDTINAGEEEDFNDTAAQIRNFIRFACEEWNTRYALLGGDSNPGRIQQGNPTAPDNDPVVPTRHVYGWAEMMWDPGNYQPGSLNRVWYYKIRETDFSGWDDYSGCGNYWNWSVFNAPGFMACDLYYSILNGTFNYNRITSETLSCHDPAGPTYTRYRPSPESYSDDALPVHDDDILHDEWWGEGAHTPIYWYETWSWGDCTGNPEKVPRFNFSANGDHNGDGEPDADGVGGGEILDNYPSVYVGRAPVYTEEDAHTFVDKVIEFERSARSNEITLQSSEIDTDRRATLTATPWECENIVQSSSSSYTIHNLSEYEDDPGNNDEILVDQESWRENFGRKK